jgi:hypothetical protein
VLIGYDKTYICLNVISSWVFADSVDGNLRMFNDV